MKMIPPPGPTSPTAQFEVQAATGVIDLDEPDALPFPELLAAKTLKIYGVPFARPVTVAVVLVDVPSANVDQLVPELLEYCTM
jgi:hypothetical protein